MPHSRQALRPTMSMPARSSLPKPSSLLKRSSLTKPSSLPKQSTFTGPSAATLHRFIKPSRLPMLEYRNRQSQPVSVPTAASASRGFPLLVGALSVMVADLTILLLVGRSLLGIPGSCVESRNALVCPQDLGVILAVAIAALVPFGMLIRTGCTELGLRREASRAATDNSYNERLITKSEYELLLLQLSENAAVGVTSAPRAQHPRRVPPSGNSRIHSGALSLRSHYKLLTLLVLLSGLSGFIIGLNLFNALSGMTS